MMKRMMQAGVLVAALAVTAQAQLTAAGSNFSGPGGGGGGASGTIGAYLPSSAGTTASTTMVPATGMPASVSGFATATGPANVTLGSGANALTVSVSAAAQVAVGTAVTTGNTASFVSSLGAVPGPQAQALGQSLASLGSVTRGYFAGGASAAAFFTTLQNAVAAYNAAVTALPAGSPVPPSLVAARALIGAYYVR